MKRPAPAELAATAHSQTAHRLVETYAATCRKRPPSQVLNDLAVQVDALLAERWTPDELGPVITAWGTKGLNPKLLASVAHEVTNRSPTSRDAASKPSTTDARMAAIQALKHHDHAADHLALPAGANP